ncbi:MAG: hypothetical protein K1Y02_06590 [Candidatus Hydrogenedentes bacterium]|nr:hypothetical protein [Candidatus Hydrogenedentota bacterium]
MKSRREFLEVSVKGAGALYMAAVASPALAAEAQAGIVPIPKARLIEVLTKVGKPPRVITNPDGTTVLLLPYGGRVLGLFAVGSEENFYWTHPALASVDTAREFYASTAWKNSGGDRTWLAPEVDIFLPEYPETSTYFQPRELDPGNYSVVEQDGRQYLVNELKLHLSRPNRDVELRISKCVVPAANPLRYEKNVDQSGVAYAGYTQLTQLEFIKTQRELLGADKSETPQVGLWNLVQMPHGGDLVIPVYSKTTPKIWFGEISGDDLIVGDRLIRYKMRAQGEHKLGVRAIATAGRVGYLYNTGDVSSLIVRNFTVNPSGDYVDAPWKDPNDLGYSTQACNVNSSLGAFSELEYHIPAIGGTGALRCDDAAQVWAFRGPADRVLNIAHTLLSADV